MHKRMTITLEEDVYDGLVRVVGRRQISRFLEDLARPHVVREDLSEAYQAMAGDDQRESQALEWSNALIGDAADASR